MVDPDAKLDDDSVGVVDMNGSYLAGTYTSNGNGSGHVHNAEGLDEVVPNGYATLVGKVVWHFRRM